MANEKRLVAGLVIKTEGRQDIAAIREELGRAGDSGARAAKLVTDALESIEGKGDSVAKAIGKGNKVQESSLDGVITKLALARGALERMEAEGVAVPAKVAAGFALAERQLQATVANIQNAKTATEQAKNSFYGVSEAAAKAAEEEAKLVEQERQAAEAAAKLAAEQLAAAAAAKELAEKEAAAAEALEKVEEKFGDLPDRMKEIRVATSLFDEQIEKLQDLQKELRKQEDSLKKLGDVGEPALKRVKVAIDAVEQELKKASSESTSTAGKMADAFTRAERAFRDVDKAIEQGSPEANEKLRKVVGTIVNLEAAIRAAKRAGAPVDDAAIARLKALDERLDATKDRVKDLSRGINKELADMQPGFTSFGDLTEKIFTQVFGGKTVGAINGVLAALTAGITIGTQFAKAIGVDFQQVDSIIDDSKGRIKNYMEVAAEGWLNFRVPVHEMVAALRLTAEQFEGLKIVEAEAGKELDNYKDKADDLAAIAKAEKQALADSIETNKAWVQAKKDAKGNVDALATAARKWLEIVDLHNKLLAGGADGEKIWSQLHVTSASTIESLNKRLKELNIDIEKFTKDVEKAIVAEERQKAAHTAWADALSKTSLERERLTKEVRYATTASHDAEYARAEAEANVRRLTIALGLQNSKLAESTARYGADAVATKELSDQCAELQRQLDAAKQALEAKVAADKDAREALAEHKKELAATTQAVKVQSNETLGLITSLNAEAKSWRYLNDERASAVDRLAKIADTEGRLDETTQKLVKQYVDLNRQMSITTDGSVDAQGKLKILSETSALEDEQQRKNIDTLGKQIIARMRATEGIRDQAGATRDLTDIAEQNAGAIANAAEETERSAEINIRWSDSAQKQRLTGAAAAAVMRDLADSTKESGAAAKHASDQTALQATTTRDLTGAVKQVAGAVAEAANATEQSTGLNIHWSDSAQKQKLSGSEAAAVMRDLADSTKESGAAARIASEQTIEHAATTATSTARSAEAASALRRLRGDQDDASASIDRATSAASAAAAEIPRVADASEHVATSARAAADGQHQVAEAQAALRTSFHETADAANSLEESLGRVSNRLATMKSLLGDVTGLIEDLPDKAFAARDAIEEMANAGLGD